MAYRKEQKRSQPVDTVAEYKRIEQEFYARRKADPLANFHSRVILRRRGDGTHHAYQPPVPLEEFAEPSTLRKWFVVVLVLVALVALFLHIEFRAFD